MRILVCGSRVLRDYSKVARALDLLPGPITEILHGDAKGADEHAATYAMLHGIPARQFDADWHRYGKAAGPMRNIRMLNERPDMVIAFPIGDSRGTRNTIKYAMIRNIPVSIIR